MEMGIVKFFDNKKLFGFATVDNSGRKIFFHFNDARNIKAGESEPVFFNGTPYFIEPPKENDYIAFRRSSDSRGRPKAAPWGPADDYLRALEEIESRPIYRLVGQYRMQKTSKQSEPEILWRGSNITELFYGIATGSWQSCYKSVTSAFYKRIDGFKARCWFEKQQEDDSWKRCKDPLPYRQNI